MYVIAVTVATQYCPIIHSNTVWHTDIWQATGNAFVLFIHIFMGGAEKCWCRALLPP